MNLKGNLLLLCWLLVAVGQFSGRVGQSGSIYLFGIIIPWLFLPVPARDRGWLLRLGAMLTALYFLFPAFNVLNKPADQPWVPAFLKESRLTTICGFAGLTMLAYAMLSFIPRWRWTGLAPERLARVFRLTCYVCTAILFAYALYQSFTGHNINPVAALREDRLLTSGLYRVTGFMTHPLSFAGFCLVMTAYLFSEVSLPLKKGDWPAWTAAALLAVLTIMSGSRAAFLVLIAYGIFQLARLSPRVRWIGMGVVALLLVAASFLGLTSRFQELLSAGSFLGERSEYWRVHLAMIADSPITGHGHYWVDQTVRDDYFKRLAPGVSAMNAHNVFLEILACVGILGSAVIAGLVYGIFRELSRFGRGRKFAEMFAVTLGFGLFQNALFDTAVMAPIFALVWLEAWQRLALPEQEV